MSDDKIGKSAYPPHVKLAMSVAMAKAAKRNNDPSLAERAEELQAEACEELAVDQRENKQTLN